MHLIDRQHAANLIGVPVAWVNGMIEFGVISQYEGDFGQFLVDEDEIIAKGYLDPKLEVSSLEHLESLLRKIGVL